RDGITRGGRICCDDQAVCWRQTTPGQEVLRRVSEVNILSLKEYTRLAADVQVVIRHVIVNAEASTDGPVPACSRRPGDTYPGPPIVLFGFRLTERDYSGYIGWSTEALVARDDRHRHIFVPHAEIECQIWTKAIVVAEIGA